jgi:hypothetical protein
MDDQTIQDKTPSLKNILNEKNENISNTVNEFKAVFEFEKIYPTTYWKRQRESVDKSKRLLAEKRYEEYADFMEEFIGKNRGEDPKDWRFAKNIIAYAAKRSGQSKQMPSCIRLYAKAIQLAYEYGKYDLVSEYIDYTQYFINKH